LIMLKVLKLAWMAGVLWTAAATTAAAQFTDAQHNTAYGVGALGGNTGGSNAAFGFATGEGSKGSFDAYFGQGAGNGASGDFSLFVGNGAGIYALGTGQTGVGPLAGRLANSDFAINVGFAAGQGADGKNLIHIGNHAGSPTYTAFPLANPTLDVASGRLTTAPPKGYKPTIGRAYRLQFEDGNGKAPTGVAHVSVIAIVEASSQTQTVWRLQANAADPGTNGYVVGLCYSRFEDDIVIGESTSDGDGEIRLGFDRTRELLPAASGTVSIGRSPDEARTTGTEGVKKWRGITSRYAGVYANANESAYFDFGLSDVRRWQWSADPVTGDLALTAYDNKGARTNTPVVVENATGRLKLMLPVFAGNKAAREAGLSPSTAYRTPTGQVMVVF
jgi:hypothetical protein